jgi:hypothetical protein
MIYSVLIRTNPGGQEMLAGYSLSMTVRRIGAENGTEKTVLIRPGAGSPEFQEASAKILAAKKVSQLRADLLRRRRTVDEGVLRTSGGTFVCKIV